MPIFPLLFLCMLEPLAPLTQRTGHRKECVLAVLSKTRPPKGTAQEWTCSESSSFAATLY